MALRVTTQDGTVFEAPDAAGIVRQMRDAAWRQQDPKSEYMEDVATRVGEAYEEDIRTTPVEFLDDLSRVGLVTIAETAEGGL
jgi:hypothetical protein